MFNVRIVSLGVKKELYEGVMVTTVTSDGHLRYEEEDRRSNGDEACRVLLFTHGQIPTWPLQRPLTLRRALN